MSKQQHQPNIPYLTWSTSPTTISATAISSVLPFLMMLILCSLSILLCSPLNCFSLVKSLMAVTRTTTTTDTRMAAPSIHPVSPSSTSPPAPSNSSGKQCAVGEKRETFTAALKRSGIYCYSK